MANQPADYIYRVSQRPDYYGLVHSQLFVLSNLRDVFYSQLLNCCLHTDIVNDVQFVKVILCASEQICLIVRYCHRSFKQL